MTMHVPNASERDVTIVAYDAFEAGRRIELDRDIDRIFFAASSVQSFRDAAHRAAFRHLWLGRYLREEPGEAFVAMCDARVCGYLVGSLADPAPRAAFAELDYFQAFAAKTARFPAHLHVNVDDAARGRGIGARLVERFMAHARARAIAGVHIVTGAGLRNVRFYERLGFREVARAPRNGAEVVMLARELAAGAGGPA